MQNRITTVFLLSLLCGCATNRNLGSLPTDPSEFRQPLASLRSHYDELDRYDRGNLFFGYCTPVEQLKRLWGEPDQVVTEWVQMPILMVPMAISAGGPGGAIGIGIAYGMYPRQPQRYIWRKGNYKIDTRVVTGIDCGYEPRIHFWEWNETRNP